VFEVNEEMPEASAFDEDADYERIEQQIKKENELIEIPIVVR